MSVPLEVVSETAAREVVGIAEAIEAVDAAFRAVYRGDAEVFPVVVGRGPGPETSFAIKSGADRSAQLVGLKVGTYWPLNRASGLASHASTTMLLDPGTGYPRALVSAGYLTAMRTAAADGVATRALARPDARVLAIVGAGHQAWFELLAVRHVRPIERVLVWSRSPENAEALAERARIELGLDASSADLPTAVGAADIIVTATAAAQVIVRSEWVKPGAHISAMGADAPGKQELEPRLIARARLFADVPAQSITLGEFEAAALAGAIDAALITPIGALLSEAAAGRVMDDDVTIFDSSGMALQDLAIGEVALQRARHAGLLQHLDLT